MVERDWTRLEKRYAPHPPELETHTDCQGFKLRPLVMSDFAVQDSHAYAHVDPSRKVPGAFMEPVD